MTKKGQAQVIVTVLIILIVLAIIGVAGTMITRMVRDSASQASEKSECIGVQLAIDSAEAGSAVSVQRLTGGPDEAINVVVYVDGSLNHTLFDMNELDTKSNTTAYIATSGEVVQIAAQLGDNLCDFADEVTVA